MLAMCSTSSDEHAWTASDFMRKRTAREGILEEFKSMMKPILSGQ
jgi:hypothetical protein